MLLEHIIGGCVAVVVAGMPAMVALLKIKELHLAVNSQLTAFIAATREQSDLRIAMVKEQASTQITASKVESDWHLQDLRKELEGVRNRNDQLLDQLAEAVKRLPVTLEGGEHRKV